MAKTINSREKGKRGEIELANYLKANGYDARRSVQFNGWQGEADVIGMPGYHIECKRVEKLNLEAAFDQSVRDAKAGEVPIVIHRKNRRKWLVTMPLEAFIALERGRNEG